MIDLKSKTVAEIEAALERVGAPQSIPGSAIEVTWSVSKRHLTLTRTMYGMGHNEPHIYDSETFTYLPSQLFPEDAAMEVEE